MTSSALSVTPKVNVIELGLDYSMEDGSLISSFK